MEDTERLVASAKSPSPDQDAVVSIVHEILKSKRHLCCFTQTKLYILTLDASTPTGG